MLPVWRVHFRRWTLDRVEPVRADTDRAPGTSVAPKASSKRGPSPSRSRTKGRSRSPLPRGERDRRAKEEPESPEEAEDGGASAESEASSAEEERERRRRREATSAARGREKPPEPPGPPPKKISGKTDLRKRRTKKIRRGGTRHQRHYRSTEDPFRRTHRPLRGETLDLAKGLAQGLQRRA